MKEYTALIIDIKNSRKYNSKQRNELQTYFLKVIDILNLMFKKDIIFDVAFSAGDEIQGLFGNTLSAIIYLRLLEIIVFPVQIRAGVGVGEWTVKIENGLSTEQDGSAYHRARQGLNEVYNMQTQRFRIKSIKEKDMTINSLLNMSMSHIVKQNDNQNMIHLLCEFLYPFVSNNNYRLNNTYAKDIVNAKNDFSIKKSRTIESKDNKIINEHIIIQETILITNNMIEPEKHIIRKNMTSNIAEIVVKSRQNISTIMNRGNIISIRTMDYVALHYIAKYYGGENDI